MYYASSYKAGRYDAYAFDCVYCGLKSSLFVENINCLDFHRIRYIL